MPELLWNSVYLQIRARRVGRFCYEEYWKDSRNACHRASHSDEKENPDNLPSRVNGMQKLRKKSHTEAKSQTSLLPKKSSLLGVNNFQQKERGSFKRSSHQTNSTCLMKYAFVWRALTEIKERFVQKLRIFRRSERCTEIPYKLKACGTQEQEAHHKIKVHYVFALVRDTELHFIKYKTG